jgi:hypothetical protein
LLFVYYSSNFECMDIGHIVWFTVIVVTEFILNLNKINI